MSVREENLMCMKTILAALDETLDVVTHELAKCKARIEHIRRGLEVEEQLGRVVDPLKAPEVVEADKNGDGGFAFRLDEDDD